MNELWWEEAERNQVLPLNNQPGLLGDRRIRRKRYEYYAGIGSLPEAVAPNLRNRSWQMTADIDNTNGDAAGVIATHGGARRRLRDLRQGRAPLLRRQLPGHRDDDRAR